MTTQMDPTTGEILPPTPTQSLTLEKLAAALAKAQAAIEGAPKNRENPHFGSKYADLASVWEAIRGPLTAHGLSVVQCPMETDGTIVKLRTVLLHESGQWIGSVFVARPIKADPQGCMSALTYLRRGALMAIVGVAPEDDDGNAASQPAPKRPARPTPGPGPGVTDIRQVPGVTEETIAAGEAFAERQGWKKPASAPAPSALATPEQQQRIRDLMRQLGEDTSDVAMRRAAGRFVGRFFTADKPMTADEAGRYLAQLRAELAQGRGAEGDEPGMQDGPAQGDLMGQPRRVGA